ncbi:MAG: cupin domain-containing protein [Fibrobacterales bacterium]
MKTIHTYWNPLDSKNLDSWEEIEGSDGNLWQITIAEDTETGDYTRLTKFLNGYHTKKFGAKSHTYPEEIFVVSGRIFDEAFNMWLEPGYFASRPPGEIHGPFKAEGDVVILEVSFPSQSIDVNE